MKTSLILACAGKGERAGQNKNKLLVKVGGVTCLERTLSVFTRSGLIDEYVVVCAARDESEIRTLLPPFVKTVTGGDTRTQSVKNALKAVTGEIVLIHDGARPFVSAETIKNCVDGALKYGGAVAAVPSRDAVCRAENGVISSYVGKSGLYSVQTPQAFNTQLIKKAYDLAGDCVYDDDGEVFSEFIGEVRIADGNADNLKITYKEDFEKLNAAPLCRVGTGFDCHRLAENRKLVLGGVEIPHDKGLLGHSDADVLTHAVMDALLSALAMRDIGYHFPDSDPAYKDADSLKLLGVVMEKIKNVGYKPYNVSAVIMADKPKLSGYIPRITEKLAAALGLSPDSVGIGATTLEGLGFIGREEGICVRAAATVIKI